MLALAGLLFFLAQPFWETKPPEQWTDHEIDTMLHASPWSLPLGPAPEVLVYFATAAPIEEAEGQLRLRGRHPMLEPDPDYVDYLRLHREETFVLAIRWNGDRFSSEAEERRMENECAMVVGKKEHKILGHFPPTTTDPVLRLVFPRDLKLSDKAVLFRLFLPGMPFPEREVEFRTKDLVYRGKLEI